MPRLRPRQSPTFSEDEILEMQELHKEFGEKSLCPNFCEKLARKFSRSISRSGKPSIQPKQVQGWFEKKQQVCKSEVVLASKQTVLPSRKQLVAPPNRAIPNGAPKTSAASKDEKQTNLYDLEFEAKSSKDGAWYDVATFLTHRILSSGEPEVRVRFIGFGAEEDEWVNVKTGVRERSLPLESTECHKVNVGDLVLCFQDKRDQSIYYDAHVLEIQKRMHDIRGCRCLFLIRYGHDNVEEKVHLRRLCRRP